MKQALVTEPVRAALTITSAAAVIALLGVCSAWAMTPSASVSGTHGLIASSSPAVHGIILAQSDEAAKTEGMEDEQKGAEEMKQGMEDEQKGAEETKQGMEDEQKGAEQTKQGMEDEQKGMEEEGKKD